MAEYYCLTTTTGNAKLTNALALGLPVVLTHLAVGDGNGAVYNPAGTQNALAREVYRAPINTILQDPENPSWLIVECVIPAAVGGWYVREAGIYDEAGDLVAIAKLPESYKASIDSGAGDDLYVRLILQHTSVSQVQLKIDPSIVLATRSYVDQQRAAHEGSRTHPEATTEALGFVELATQPEVDAGADDKRPVTPKTLKGWVKQATETVFGLLRVATQTQVDAGTDDATAVTPKKLRWGFAVNLGPTGYVALPTWLSGIIWQWGQKEIPTYSTSANTDVVFPLAFPSICLCAVASTGVATTNFDAFGEYRQCQEITAVAVPTTTGFDAQVHVLNLTGHQRTMRWLAIGY